MACAAVADEREIASGDRSATYIDAITADEVSPESLRAVLRAQGPVFANAVEPVDRIDDATLTACIRAMKGQRELLLRNRDAVRRALTGYGAHFAAHFPDAIWRGPVLIIPSLCTFDGRVMTVDGRETFVLGIDGFTRHHSPDWPVRPFLDAASPYTCGCGARAWRLTSATP